MPEPRFILAGDALVAVSAILSVDLSEVDRLRVVIRHEHGQTTAEGVQAVEALMLLKPSALEGRRLRWARRAWLLHNLVGHPLMQLFAFFGRYDLAMRLHDGTVPKPTTGVRR